MKGCDWIVTAWTPANISQKVRQRGVEMCYMQANNLDAPMAKFDHVTTNADMDALDWEAEVKNLTEIQRHNMFVSPLNAKSE